MTELLNELERLIENPSLSHYCESTNRLEIEEACVKIREYIRNGVHLGVTSTHNYFRVPLWSAIRRRCHLNIIQILYEAHKDSCKIKWPIHMFSDYETREFSVEPYTFEHLLSGTFGPLLRDMKRCKPDDIEYLEGLLHILHLKEEDIDWDLTLKSGHHD